VPFSLLWDAIADGVRTEWKVFRAMPLILSVVCRTTNKILVGLPLRRSNPAQRSLFNTDEGYSAGRNPEYLEINTNFTQDVMVTAYTLRLLPRFLRL
jgi:hypothetical protein